MYLIIFATHNPNKVKEIQDLLPEHIQLKSLEDMGMTDEIIEDGDTIEENARIKAEAVANRFNMPCFADDTGLEVDALDGKPGVKSARYAGEIKDDEANKRKLLQKLENQEERTARFKTVIVYKNGDIEQEFSGICEGDITIRPSGNAGFGYDPIFQPKGFTKTFAEMTASEKNSISHRSLAFQQLIEYLKP